MEYKFFKFVLEVVQNLIKSRREDNSKFLQDLEDLKQALSKILRYF